MREFVIKEEDAQEILNYISSIPTGGVVLGKAVQIVNLLLNLKEKDETDKS